MGRGFGQGPPQSPGFSPELQQLERMANYAISQAKDANTQAQLSARDVQAMEGQHKLITQHLTDLSNVLSQARVGGAGNGNPDLQFIESVPGKRIHYDELVAIQISANDASKRTGTITITTEGPFVAVSRYATFLSDYSYQYTDPQTLVATTFLGRSNGRFRPIHSMADIMDAQLPADVQRVVAMPGTGAPSYSSPALHAPYRTMEFDGRIKVIDQGSGFPRSNIDVPTPFWTTFINSPFQLAALDFFARASVIQIEVTPGHVNNPNAGGLIGFGAGGAFPFSQAQFDHHEGVNDTENLVVPAGGTDPANRLPNGTLFVGFHGYRIIQPPGAVVSPSSI